jgi:hypothetical protein
MSGITSRLALAASLAVLSAWLAWAGTAWASYTVTPSCNSQGQPISCAGWHMSPVQVSWTWSPTDGSATDGSCLTQSYWFDVMTSATCNVAGPQGSGGTVLPIMVEMSTPTVTVMPARAPDFSGWYNHPVAASVTGSAFSGIDSCTGSTYAGPESASATVTGSCTDKAGKVLSATSAAFPYDATPPQLNVTVDPGDGVVLLSWPVSPTLTLVQIQRAPGLRGGSHSVVHRGDSGSYRDAQVRNGVRYRYTITVRDQAGNITIRTFTVKPGLRLLTPAPGAAVSTPVLTWTPVRGADYYNVQLFRGGKILSTWPSQARLRLARTWIFAGRRYRLTPGRYRWYVWPGFGVRSGVRYGPLIGSRSFVVR